MSSYRNKQSGVSPVNTPEISSGSGAPSSTPGAVGDFYIDTSTPGLYYAKATASSDDWVAVTNA